MEDHTFKCTLSFSNGGDTSVVIRSRDGSIVHREPISEELLGMFESGQYIVFCEGKWCPREELVWLGKEVTEEQWLK